MDITELKRISGNQFRRHPWELARASMVAFLLRRFKPRSRTILDMGSGDAFLLNSLREKDLAGEYVGVDTAYDDKIIERIRDTGVHEKIMLLNDRPSPASSGKPDTCLLLDVLEHCENDAAVLRELSDDAVTEKDAVFFITVPAFQSLFSGHDHLLGHYRRYSRRQLNELCRSQGLKVVASGYFFFSLIPARYIEMLGRKNSKNIPKSALDGWRGGRLFSRIFYAILWADSRFCYLLSAAGIHLPGLSAYSICRKQPS